MDEAGERAVSPIAGGPATVGARLRAAREARGQTLDEIGKQTRIPVRHLVQIEGGQLDGLPAAPYSAGFVKAYARAVDLDPVAMSQQFRAEFAASMQKTPRIAYEPYEPADPVRLPPRLLAIVALVIAVMLVAGYAIWRSGLVTGEGADERARLAASGAPEDVPENNAAPTASQSAKPAAPTSGPVRIIATQATWIEVTDRAGGTRLYTGVLAQGQSWDVPASAGDPVIRTGKPEELQVTVGGRPVAPLGEPAHTISDVSLKAASLTATPAPLDNAGVQAAATAPTPAPRHRSRTIASPPTASAPTPAAEPDDSATVPPAFRATVAPANASTPQL